MSRPNVSVEFGNGFLDGQNKSDDGVSGIILTGIAVSGKVVLGTIYKLRSEQDAINLGLDAQYDIDNSVLVHKHIADFYSVDGTKGIELQIMVVDNTVTMEDMCDKTLPYAKKMSADSLGKVKMIGITKVAAAASISNGLDIDVYDSIAAAKELRADEAQFIRYIRFIHEGKDFSGNVNDLKDLRDAVASPNANRSSIVLSNDYDYGVSSTIDNYASVGLALGCLAAKSVNQNMGRVKSGALPVITAGMSSGDKVSDFSDTDQDDLNDMGYICMRNFPRVAGWFWNDDHTAVPLTDDYCQIANGRVIDKAAEITYETHVLEILDDVEVDDETGELLPSSKSHFEGIIEDALNAQMGDNKEINPRSARCVIPAGQNLKTGSTLKYGIAVGKKGVFRQLKATVGFGITA